MYYGTADTIIYDFHIKKVSEEYYKYEQTSQLQFDIGGDPFSQPVPVFNNIENGFGIFAGYNGNSVKYYREPD
ncbi:MAG: hypothetical protein ACJA08_002089 [Cyclobacteriaceae bacterium]